MAQGRGSSRPASTALGFAPICVCLCLLVHLNAVESAVFTVGGSDGWDINMDDWIKGKSFKAGDVLVFKYDPEAHDVTVVDAAGYNSCKASPDSEVFTSGGDRITIRKGHNYFICSVSEHCTRGMKIAVNAA